MHIVNTKRTLLGFVLLLGIAGQILAASSASAGDDTTPPELPAECSALQVPPGNKVASRVYAVGVQAYRWNGKSWIFVEPIATLFNDESFHKKFGVHYAGPTWESNNGGKVVAARQEGCTPDPTAIPWLLLRTVTADVPGVLGKVTYIQRVNTKGGLVPTAPGSAVGVVEVPYSTEYYFYRADD